MSLSVVNNVASLAGQNNLAKTSSMLNKSLERLSSGLKVNRGADGPAALVISEQQRAQIAGLQKAIENTSKAVNVVQTGEGAMNEINRLLVKARSLALDSANTGVNGSDAMAANQAELTNLLDTIDRISTQTQFGTRRLLDGSSGMNGSTDDADVTFLKATTASATGTWAVTVGTAAEKAHVDAGTAQAAALAANETLNINGVQVGLTAGMTQAQVVSRINDFTGQTGVTADAGGAGGATRLISVQYGAGAKITAQSNVAAAANSSGIGTTTLSDSGVDIAGTIAGVAGSGVGDVLTGLSGSGKGVSLKFGLAAGSQTDSVSGAQGNVTIVDQSLNFQIGANSSQTAKIAINSVRAGALGVNVVGQQFSSLAALDIRTSSGAQDAIKVIDSSINEITTLRGDLGAFQQNTLEATTNNLRATLENTTAAESTIRDTDFAEEVAVFTKNQTLMQSGISVLSNANQLPQLVLSLLK